MQNRFKSWALWFTTISNIGATATAWGITFPTNKVLAVGFLIFGLLAQFGIVNNPTKSDGL